MPLTPEAVVEKRFNPTRVREGYAQDEVDDFLDEVVAELRRLNGENAELRGQLNQCQARVAELTRAGAQPAPAAEAPVAQVPVEDPTEAVFVEDVVEAPEVHEAAVVEETPAEAEVVPQPRAEEDATVRAAGVIALAQRLHDEYVKEGESARDSLLAAAQEQAQQVVSEAEARRDRTLGELEGRRQQLEDSINQLHGRETSYREQLEGFIAGQLEDLRRVVRVVPDDAVTSR